MHFVEGPDLTLWNSVGIANPMGSPVTDNILSCVRSDEKYLCGDGPGKKVKKLEDIYSY